MSEMECKCGYPLHRIEGCSSESEGIRSDYWCPECKTIFSCHASGLYPMYKLEEVKPVKVSPRFLMREAVNYGLIKCFGTTRNFKGDGTVEYCKPSGPDVDQMVAFYEGEVLREALEYFQALARAGLEEP